MKNLETEMIAAFREGLKNGMDFMDWNDLGKLIWGNGYIPQTRHIFDKMMSERMGRVREIAEEQGILIIPKRKPTAKNKEKKFRILGWKIAAESDKKYIEDELIYKLNSGTARKNSAVRFIKTAVQNNMLPETKLRELEISNQ